MKPSQKLSIQAQPFNQKIKQFSEISKIFSEYFSVFEIMRSLQCIKLDLQ